MLYFNCCSKISNKPYICIFLLTSLNIDEYAKKASPAPKVSTTFFVNAINKPLFHSDKNEQLSSNVMHALLKLIFF